MLYTRRGCPLCEEAEDIVAALVPGQATVVDVDSDPGLVRRFGDRVPVLAVVDALPGEISPGAVVPGAVGPEAVWMEGRFDEPLLVRLLTSGGPASSLQSPSVRARASDPGDRAGR
ncbi:MAG: glutaredoxin family protein [Planctomycetia bacterium]